MIARVCSIVSRATGSTWGRPPARATWAMSSQGLAIEPFGRLTRGTVTVPAVLRAEPDCSWQHGWAVSHEKVNGGLSGVSWRFPIPAEAW